MMATTNEEEDNQKSTKYVVIFKELGIKLYSSYDVSLKNTLGKKLFANVFKGTLKLRDVSVYFEQISRKHYSDNSVSFISKKLKTISGVGDVNFLPEFLGVVWKELNGVEHFGYIFDFIEGDTLDEYIHGHPNLKALEKCELAIQIVENVKYLHKFFRVHTSLKPANIIIKKLDGKIVILDFGLYKNNFSRYSPPETLSKLSKLQDEEEKGILKYDVWSLGCLIMELFSGISPWVNKYNDDLLSVKIAMLSKKKYDNDMDFAYPESFTLKFPEVSEILKNCLVANVDERLSCEELLEELKCLELFYKKT